MLKGPVGAVSWVTTYSTHNRRVNTNDTCIFEATNNYFGLAELARYIVQAEGECESGLEGKQLTIGFEKETATVFKC